MQYTLSRGPFPDEALAVSRAYHIGISDGTLRPRLDLGRYFRQRRLPGVE
ncbi:MULTISPECIES: hypothetical protein [unclassified Methanoculleus]|jgi:hypothetical protein|uniref:Uncharacterized protein n=1 Tax=Methanoculleus palmolei TaxID=72612 RepID=A0ABD8A6C5_9EURY|nr:hypothetical protein [Methanoculleus sp. UBA377]WOX55079.1 hypothetical protein R6Y95_06275 [Methanoculleus palmolei]